MADEPPPASDPPPPADPAATAAPAEPAAATEAPQDVATELLPPAALKGGRSPSMQRRTVSRGRSATPLRGHSMTPLLRHQQEKSSTPISWRSITPFLDREPRDKTPFELGSNILLQLASYQAIFDKALVMDISQPDEKPARCMLSEHSVLDQAAIMDISCVEYVYIEEDEDPSAEGGPSTGPIQIQVPVAAPRLASLDADAPLVIAQIPLGAVPSTIVPPPPVVEPPPPPTPEPVVELVLPPLELVEEIREVTPPPPTPVAPVVPEPIGPVKKVRKFIYITTRERAIRRRKKEKRRLKRLAKEKARKLEEARLAELARIAREEEEARLLAEEEEEERLRIEQEAEELALAEALAAEEARLAELAALEEEQDDEDAEPVEEKARESSEERFMDPDADLGKWNKLKSTRKGVVRGRSDGKPREKLTEHERDKEWQRRRELARLPRISVHLKDVAVKSGQTARLSCSVDGPSLQIKWYRDGDLLDRSPKYKQLVSDGLITLEIVRAVPNDSGRYRCRLVNNNGDAVTSATLTVYTTLKSKPQPPMFTMTRDFYRLQEDILTIEAHCHGSPRPKITWVRNVVELKNTFKYAPLEEAHGVYKLEIYKPTFKDSGQYTIRAQNSVGTLECIYDVHFIGKPLNYHITGVSNAHAGYLKTKEAAALQAVDDALYAKEQYELIKSGGYVTPYRKPRAPPLGPSRLKFATQLRDRVAVVGQALRFTCLVIGSDPDIHWLKDDKPVKHGKHVRSLTTEGLTVLDIDKVTLEMTGEFKCVARSEHCEDISTSCYVRVFEARQDGDKSEPIFLLSIRDAHHTKDNDLVIDCKVGGNPLPIIEWFKNDAPVELNERVQQVESADGQSAIMINEPTAADSGLYKCRATNKLGTVEQEHEVIFTPPVVPVGGRREYSKAKKDPGDDIMGGDTPAPPAKEVKPAAPAPAVRHVQIPETKPENARGTKTEYDESPAPLGGYKTSMVLEEVEYVRRHVVPSMRDIRNISRNQLSFGTNLTNRVVAAGGRAKLSCYVAGPDPMPRWTKDDVALKFGAKYKNASGDGIIGMEVMNCRPEDSGQYELTVKNSVSCITTMCKLEVYSVRKSTDLKPTFTRNLKHVYHVDSNQIILETHVRAEPTPTIEWSYNCMPIDKDMVKYRQKFHADGKCELVISYPHPIDGGKYKCLASNRAGDSSIVHNVVFEGREEYIEQNRVRMFLADKKRVARAKLEIRGGLPERREDDDDAEFEPADDGGAEDEVVEDEAAVDEVAVDAPIEAAVVGEDGAVVAAVDGVDAEDADEEPDPAGGQRPKSAVKTGTIRFVTNILDRVVAVGSKVRVAALMEGNVSIVRWFKNDQKLPSTPRCRLANENGVVSLTLRSATEADSAVYKCVARNSTNEASTSAKLQVYTAPVGCDDQAPMFIKALRDSYSSKISEITLSCNVRGTPTPYIIWTKDRMPIQENAKYHMTQLEDGTCELLVSFADWKDLGHYVCKAENRVGKCELSHFVDVKLKKPSTTKLYNLPNMTEQPKVTFAEADELGAEEQLEELEVPPKLSAQPLYERRHQPEMPYDPKRNLHFGTYCVSVAAAIGTMAKFTCYITGPNPKCTWYKEDPKCPGEPTRLESCHKSKFKTVMDNGLATLIIKRVAPDDDGKYIVIARNEASEITCSASLTSYWKKHANRKPIFINSIKDHYNMHDDELILECRVHAEPRPRIAWKLNDRTITFEINNRSKQRAKEDGYCQLVISEPQPSDNGIYTCVAINELGRAKTTHNVQFEGREAHGLVKSYGFAHRNVKLPHILNHIGDHTVTKGGYIGLIAELQNEVTEVQWFHNNQKLLPWSSKVTAFQEYNVYTLVVPKVTADDAGTYMCRAISEFGRAESVGHVDIVGPRLEFPARSPQFLQRPPVEQLIATGDPFEFAVTMDGNPKPKLSLYKGLKDITRNPRVVREQNEDHFRVSIENTDPSDSGTYWLVARNEHGTDRAYVTITVKLCKRRHKKRKPHHEV